MANLVWTWALACQLRQVSSKKNIAYLVMSNHGGGQESGNKCHPKAKGGGADGLACVGMQIGPACVGMQIGPVCR